MGEGALRPEARCHTDAIFVNATGGWSQANYPGEGRCSADRLAALRDAAMGYGQSAEAIVCARMLA